MASPRNPKRKVELDVLGLLHRFEFFLAVNTFIADVVQQKCRRHEMGVPARLRERFTRPAPSPGTQTVPRRMAGRLLPTPVTASAVAGLPTPPPLTVATS